MNKAVNSIAVIQILAGCFGLGWAAYSIYNTQSIQGLVMLWTVLHFFAVAAGIQLIRGESFGLILSLFFQVPQLVFWETTNHAFRFLSGVGFFVKNGSKGAWSLDFTINSTMNYRSGWGQSQISPEIGINLIALVIVILLTIHAFKVRLNPCPEKMLTDFSNT